jgi:hypothetical protein
MKVVMILRFACMGDSDTFLLFFIFIFCAYVYDNLIFSLFSLRCSNPFFGRNYIKGMESSRWTYDLGN